MQDHWVCSHADQIQARVHVEVENLEISWKQMDTNKTCLCKLLKIFMYNQEYVHWLEQR